MDGEIGAKWESDPKWTELEKERDNLRYLILHYIYRADKAQLDRLTAAVKDVIGGDE